MADGTTSHPPRRLDRDRFERLYAACNSPRYVYPDPLSLVLDFPDTADREIAALLASTLAYGRVAQILSSLGKVFGIIGSPSLYLRETPRKKMDEDFAGFKHRWTTGGDLAGLLEGVKDVLGEYSSLEAFFLAGMGEDDLDVIPALESFVEGLGRRSGAVRSGLLPSPSGGSACKRLNLFLRWMVRDDEVDPGGWKEMHPSMLIVPLDTHMHRICRTMGMTARKQADLRCALEITEAFRTISPSDPVKYDFALTRLGIRDDFVMEEFFDQN